MTEVYTEYENTEVRRQRSTSIKIIINLYKCRFDHNTGKH